MAATQRANVGLYEGWVDGESGWGDNMNLNLAVLDALLQGRVQAELSAPPGSPTEGLLWIVGDTATGAWASQEEKLALWYEAAWVFITPKLGWNVQDLDRGARVSYTVDGWFVLDAGVFNRRDVAGTSHTVTAADANTVIVFDSASACTLTLPDNALEILPAGFHCYFRNKDVGVITLTPTGTDVVEGAGTATQNSRRSSVYKESSGVWVSEGDLV